MHLFESRDQNKIEQRVMSAEYNIAPDHTFSIDYGLTQCKERCAQNISRTFVRPKKTKNYYRFFRSSYYSQNVYVSFLCRYALRKCTHNTVNILYQRHVPRDFGLLNLDLLTVP